MSQQGAVLQGYNNELVKCIEDLCVKRDELQRHIVEEEDEKRKLQNDIRMLTDRLAKVNESLSKKITARNEFDRLIAETEAAYTKILESSQTLLSVVKKESQSLGCHLPQHKHRAGGSVLTSTAAVNRTGPPPASSTS